MNIIAANESLQEMSRPFLEHGPRCTDVALLSHFVRPKPMAYCIHSIARQDTINLAGLYLDSVTSSGILKL